MLQLKKIPFYCFSAPTLIPQAIKKVAAMKGLARAPGVIGGQQLTLPHRDVNPTAIARC